MAEESRTKRKQRAQQVSDRASNSDASKLRLALFCANFNGVPDGASKSLNRLVAFLLDRGAAVRIYSPTVRNPPFKPPIEPIAVPSVPIPTRPEYRLSLGLNRRLREDVARFAPNVVHISVPDRAGLQAQRLAGQLGVPVVASLHTRFETYLSYYGLGFLRPIIERRLRRFYSRCDAVLVPNELIAEELRARGWATNVHVWKRGVDRNLFNPGRRSAEWRRHQGFDDDDIVLLFFGRLVREKGLGEFAALVEELRRRGHRSRLLFVGEGPERAAMARHLPGAVFTGHLDGEALAQAVASADILMNPSVTEAFGNVNLEAMASGLAIVSADVPSAQALIVNGQSGLLVAPGAITASVEAIETLIQFPSLRKELAAAAVEACAAFDWDQLLAPVLDLYLRITIKDLPP
jgi:glycosyltransferase involved in cell wall biosynthesis